MQDRSLFTCGVQLPPLLHTYHHQYSRTVAVIRVCQATQPSCPRPQPSEVPSNCTSAAAPQVFSSSPSCFAKQVPLARAASVKSCVSPSLSLLSPFLSLSHSRLRSVYLLLASSLSPADQLAARAPLRIVCKLRHSTGGRILCGCALSRRVVQSRETSFSLLATACFT